MHRRRAIGPTLAALLLGGCAGDAARLEPDRPPPEGPGVARAPVAAPEVAPPRVELGTCRLLRANQMSTWGDLDTDGMGFSPFRGGQDPTPAGGQDPAPAGGLGPAGAKSSGGKPPKVVMGKPSTDIGLDKQSIRRAIQSGRPKVKHCYEKQLLVDPNLSGTVTVKFTIDPNGQVVRATAQGMHDGVALCVANVMKGLRFPKPSGGGIVQVSYPFKFVSTGSSAAPTSQPTVPVAADPPTVLREGSGVLGALTGVSMPGHGCLDVEPGASVEAALPAVEACYQRELELDAGVGGRLYAELRADAAGAVSESLVTGVGSQRFRDCVAGAFAAATLPEPAEADAVQRAMVCSIALHNPQHQLDAKAVERVTVEVGKLRLGDTVLGNQIEWSTDPAGNAWRALNLLLQALPPDDEDRTMVVHGEPLVDAAAFVTNVSFIARETERHHFVYARAAADDGRTVLNPLGSPAWSKHCGDVPTPEPLVALLAPDGIWVGTADGRELLEPVDGEPYLIGYSRALRGLKRVRYRHRSDLEIAALPGVPYRYLASMIEIAVDTGFFDVVIVDVDSLAVDPRKLAPRARP